LVRNSSSARPGVGQPELAAASRDGEVRHADEADTAAGGRAVDRGNHRCPHARKATDRRVYVGGQLGQVAADAIALPGHALQVAAKTKMLARPGDDDGSHGRVALDAQGDVEQVAAHGHVERVRARGIVQRDGGDAVAHLNQYSLVHRSSGTIGSNRITRPEPPPGATRRALP
jgi:hypothetical protein